MTLQTFITSIRKQDSNGFILTPQQCEMLITLYLADEVTAAEERLRKQFGLPVRPPLRLVPQKQEA